MMMMKNKEEVAKRNTKEEKLIEIFVKSSEQDTVPSLPPPPHFNLELQNCELFLLMSQPKGDLFFYY